MFRLLLLAIIDDAVAVDVESPVETDGVAIDACTFNVHWYCANKIMMNNRLKNERTCCNRIIFDTDKFIFIDDVDVPFAIVVAVDLIVHMIAAFHKIFIHVYVAVVMYPKYNTFKISNETQMKKKFMEIRVDSAKSFFV